MSIVLKDVKYSLYLCKFCISFYFRQQVTREREYEIYYNAQVFMLVFIYLPIQWLSNLRLDLIYKIRSYNISFRNYTN